MKLNKFSKVTLNNGVQIPWIGLGTWDQGPAAESAVIAAIQGGYRSIDTGSFYQNEAAIGRGMRKSGVPRNELFLTTKVWNSEQGYEATLKSCEVSLRTLELDYIDLYLIHWPVAGKYKETWRALEKLYQEGRVKSIGVSNFAIHHLDDLATTATVVPAVNQIDLHPLKTSTALRAFCAAHGIQVEAWAPLAQGRLFDRKELAAIASRYGKTISQVVLRWHLQNEIVVIPKSNHPQRLAENIDIFDFELSPEHIAEISAMNEDLLVLGFDSDHIPEAILVPPAANWPYSL